LNSFLKYLKINFRGRKKVSVVNNDPAPEDTLARREESPEIGEAHSKLQESTRESRIPKIKQRVQQDSTKKSHSHSQK